jgi:hypothetical protein
MAPWWENAWKVGVESIVQDFQIAAQRASLFGAALLVVFAACGSPGASQNSQPDGDAPVGARETDEARPITQVAAAEPDEVRILTGARTRVVWTQDGGKGTDIGSKGDRLILMGYDSHDGLGERPILSKRANYAKPLITPLGNRVVFSNRLQGSVFVVNWDGSGLRKLGKGFALATWIDPDTRIEWVYVGTDEVTDPIRYEGVTRYQIDRWDVSEVVWDKRRVSGDTFQVSADGRLAGGLFPWPNAGIVELPNGSWRRLGRGCWTSLAGGGTPLFWYFDGSHRNLTVVEMDRDERWEVNINNAPGIDGYEIYHPRWANHPRFLTVTGPYTRGKKANKIRGGGRQVEIYLGRFAADFTTVEAWVKVSNNRRADFYPDAWIDPSERPPARMTRDVRPGPEAPSTAPDRKPAERLVVEARVLEAAPIPTPESILPYRRAMLVNEYEVVQVLDGTYEETKLLVAHWVIRDGQVLSTAAREQGSVHRMTLGAYDEHDELEGERLVMDSDAFDLRLYYDIDS